MDFPILYAIQSIRTPALDAFWLFITNLAGANGELWLIAGTVLTVFKKTRRWGLSVLITYAWVYFFGNLLLKEWVARPRPCHIDKTIQLLVSRPSSFSCPSTHAAWAIGSATALLFHNKKVGIPVLVFAIMVCFSRVYLFVHFPSDVLFGAALGIMTGCVAFCLMLDYKY